MSIEVLENRVITTAASEVDQLFSQLIKSMGPSSRKVQLICFPFAGGYSAAFRPLQPHLQDHCDLLAVEPPGHGTNRMDLVDNLESLVQIYMNEMSLCVDDEFVLFGHSMGGVVAYRLAQRLEKQGIFPRATILSAVQPPHIRYEPVSNFDDDRFLSHVISIGGIPDELSKDRAALEFFLPAFRSDFRALETFVPAERTPLQSQVHVFNGEEDKACLNEAHGWKEWANRVRFHEFAGGHMFLLSEIQAVAKRILLILSSVKTNTDKKRRDVVG